MPKSSEATIISLGSNLSGSYPSSRELLDAAVLDLARQGLKIRSRSSWWKSSSWPDPSGPPYLNGVLLVETELEPQACLKLLHAVEARFGRTRHGANLPRTLDLDLIAMGRLVYTSEDLILPHPRAHKRRFVMGPLAEIAPCWLHPTLGMSCDELVWGTSVGNDAVPRHSAREFRLN